MSHFWPISAVGELGYELMKKLSGIVESYANYVEGFFFSCSKFDLFLNFVQNFKFFLIQCKEKCIPCHKKGSPGFYKLYKLYSNRIDKNCFSRSQILSDYA